MIQRAAITGQRASVPIDGRSAARDLPTTARRAWSKLDARAWQPVDASSLAVFRVLFGLIGIVTVARFFAYGWIDQLYVAPAHHFTYYGFSWVHPLPAAGMYAAFVSLGLLSAAIMAGYRYRLAMALYFAGFTYIELIDQTTYLNHYYWVSIASFVAIFLPLNAAWSVDRAQGRARGPATAPALTLWTMRATVAMVYLFAGLAKVNADWLLHAQPLHIWLSAKTHLPLVGPWMDEMWVAYAFSWGGAVFDLTIAGWLLWRRSRPFAYVFVVGFHIATWVLFPIGIFPWLMISGALLFMGPDWPRRAIGRAARRLGLSRPIAPAATQSSSIPRPAHRTAAVLAVGAFSLLQAALPFRSVLYPGDTRWTEEGYRFSWWVLLTEKTGFAEFRVADPATGRTWLVTPDAYLTPLQVERSAFRPDMLLQTAHIVAGDFAARGIPGVQVYADVFVTMNGRPSRRLIDPAADLASKSETLRHKDWLLPLD
jgi:hypothetical protein